MDVGSAELHPRTLSRPLLLGQDTEPGVHRLDVGDVSHSWIGLPESTTSLPAGPPVFADRAARYEKRARAERMVAAASIASKEEGGDALHRKFHRLWAYYMIMTAIALNFSSVSMLLLVAQRRYIFAAVMAGPLLTVMTFVGTARMFHRDAREMREKCRREGRYLERVGRELYIVIVLGIGFGGMIKRGHDLLQGKQQANLDSFVREVNRLDRGPDLPHIEAYFTCLLSSLLLVALTCNITVTPVWDSCFSSMYLITVLQLANVLAGAMVNFDYQNSSYLKRCYTSSSFVSSLARQYCVRTVELLSRLMVLVAATLEAQRNPTYVVLLLLIDVTCTFAVLWSAAGGCHSKLLVVAFVSLTTDVCLFLDQELFLTSTLRVSCAMQALRSLAVAAAAQVYALRVYSKTQRFAEAPNTSAMLVLLAVMLTAQASSMILSHGIRKQLAGVASQAALSAKSPDPFADYKSCDREIVATFMSRAQPSTMFFDGSLAEVDQLVTQVFGQALEDLEDRRERKFFDLVDYLFEAGLADQLLLIIHKIRERYVNKPKGVCLMNLRLVGFLGSGGFGKVLKVKDTRSANEYALKLQSKTRATSYAIREAEALHKAKGERVQFCVKLEGVFHTRDHFGILLELCECNLNEHILQHEDTFGRAGGLPETAVQNFTSCLVLALGSLHAKQFVFRDLKPENVLLSDGPGGRVAKLADFGLARSVEAEVRAVSVCMSSPSSSEVASTSSLTRAIGTPAFMPEEAYHSERLRASSDVEALALLSSRDWYALGCCMLLMLLGENGGRRVGSAEHVVLLPPGGRKELEQVLQGASSQCYCVEDALQLVKLLTRSDASIRGGFEEACSSPFLRARIEALKQLSAKEPANGK
eukprot:TRINITY_DN34078_c0_g1_i1.p1 TRINITY_DN34078_c0_g1~~TRINITY_DN34078_c0_g1_i1.p1  ORF type:complete len:882 (+),score=153.09 TRINITY_DN34078_c0_g1_i1:34-2646(+)